MLPPYSYRLRLKRCQQLKLPKPLSPVPAKAPSSTLGPRRAVKVTPDVEKSELVVCPTHSAVWPAGVATTDTSCGFLPGGPGK